MNFTRPLQTIEPRQARNQPSGYAGFGALLVMTGKLSDASLDRATRLAAESGEALELILTRLGLIGERELAEALATYLGLPLLAARDFPEAPILEDRLNRKFVKEARIIPLADRPEGIAMAMADPFDDGAAQAVEFAVGKPVLRHVATPSDIDAAYERLYGEGKSEIAQILDGARERADEGASDDIERLKDSASEAPVIRLVNLLIARAVEARASDIHIEPMDAELRIRYRIDGVLQNAESPPANLRAAVISRVKIMAKLNIAERRLAR
jgi:general secretion pathway protein E